MVKNRGNNMELKAKTREGQVDPQGMSFTRSKWDTNWDKRGKDKEGGEMEKPTATRHLILIRHGQYNLNGKTDQERALTQLGRRQAKGTGTRLAQLDMDYTKIVVSTMERARETADIIAKELPSSVPREDPDAILVEGEPIKPEPDFGWRPEASYYTGGARIEAAFRKYFHRASVDQTEDSHEVIVCHANVIRYFLCRALQLPPEAWLRISLKNASITWFTIRPNGNVSVRCLGDAGHFPPDMLTTS